VQAGPKRRMIRAMDEETSVATRADDHPYRAELDLERERWTEIVTLCRSLSPEERVRPGYYHDPEWTVKDLVAHLGTWMAEAEIQLLQIEAGTYVEEPLDVDALNAQFLAAMHDQEWSTVWAQAFSGRAQMLTVWSRLHERTEAADRWVWKSGAEHHGEHLPRLREWVAELRTGATAGDPG
jgi:hypothetical protein